jgi:hypothetical protein
MATFPQLAAPIPFGLLRSELASAVVRAQMGKPYSVRIDDALTREHLRNSRRYAAVTAHAESPTFFFAEQTLWLPFEYRLGLIAHEIGHVIDPDPLKTEDGADRHGMAALDLLITYDCRWPGKGLQVAVR